MAKKKKPTARVKPEKNGAELATLAGHTDWVRACAVTPDGRRVVSGSDDQTLKVWDLETGREVATLAGHTGYVWACAVTPDGRRVVSGSDDKTLKVWDLENLKAVAAPSIRYTNAKVLLVGETSTGKTCLARALMGKPFEPQESTHGMRVWSFHSETATESSGESTERETFLWDLAGQPDYQIIHQLFLDKTSVGVVLFDPTHPEKPFGGVSHWEKALRRVAGEDCPKLLVAGRVDRGHPTATPAMIEEFRREHGFDNFIATSAKTGEGVEELRKAIARAIPWKDLSVTTSPQLWKDIR
ncbi:MAG: GTP-binding protein [bacterium]